MRASVICIALATLIAATANLVAATAKADVAITIEQQAKAGSSLPVALQFKGSGGYDLGGISPRAWLVPETQSPCAVPASSSGAIEIEGKRLIVFHNDHTVSSVDSARSLATSNIAWISTLPTGYGAWLIDRERGHLVVARPREGEIHRIDLADGETVDVLSDVGHPTHLVNAPEIDAIWSVGSGQVYRLNADGSTTPHEMSGQPGSIAWIGHRRVLALGDDDGGLQLLGADGSLQKMNVGIPITDLATSSLADTLYVLSSKARQILVLPLDSLANAPPDAPVRTSIELPEAATSLKISPDGRWLFALEGSGVLHVIDTSRNRLTRILRIHAGISDAAFSEGYLYLYERSRAYVSMIQLASLARSDEHVIAIPSGVSADEGRLAPLGPDGMAFLNPTERTAFLYMESGMSDGHGTMRSPTEMFAPYAAIKLRGGLPQGIAVHNLGFRETRPGYFTTRVRPPYGGAWRLVASDAKTGEVGCADIVVAGPSQTAEAAPARFRLEQDHDSGKGMKFRIAKAQGVKEPAMPASISMLAFSPGSNWQQRLTARRQDDGAYHLDAELPPGLAIAIVPLHPGFAGGSPLMIRTAP